MIFGDGSGDGEAKVLIALDHCVLGENEIAKILQPAFDLGVVEPQQVTTTCSHPHAAGLMLLDRAELPGGEGIAPYLDSVAETVKQIIGEAKENVAPVTMSFTTGRCDLAAHRDMWDDGNDQWVCGFHPDGPADDTVVVGRITNAAGEVVAGIVNYACHPTTLAWDNRRVSPDFPGAMRDVIESVIDAPTVFLQGASGDLGPVRGYVGDLEQADKNGRQLGYAALSALESLPPAATEFHYAGPVVSGATIGFWEDRPSSQQRAAQVATFARSHADLDLPYRDDNPTPEEVEVRRGQLLEQESAATAAGDEQLAGDLRAQVERLTRAQSRFALLPPDSYPYQLSAWRTGDIIWLIVPGEPYQNLQVELRERFPQYAIVVITIADHWGPSYLPPQELYGSGIYQETIAVLMPGTLETVIESAAQLIDRL